MFDALYKKFLETSRVSSAYVDAAAFPPCLLHVHALGRRYDQGLHLKSRVLVQKRGGRLCPAHQFTSGMERERRASNDWFSNNAYGPRP